VSLPDAPRGGSASLRFRVGPVPVSIHVSTPIVLALLGPGLGDPAALAVWIVVGILSIVIHELGHAAVVRVAGGEPRVDLQWLGGLTRYQPTDRLRTRWWSVAVSLAGPATGIAIGFALLWLEGLVAITQPLLRLAVDFGYFVSFVWAVFNLLPVLPLDGGQAVRALLPGTPAERTRRAAVVGTVVGVAVVALSVWIDQVFLALFVGLLTWQNVRLLRPPSSGPAGGRSGANGRQVGDGQVGDATVATGLDAVRQQAREGLLEPDALVAAVRRAAQDGDHIAVVELVNIALGRGVRDPRLPWQAARSWTRLDQHDRAVRMVAVALQLGAEPRQLAADPELQPLRDHPAFSPDATSGEEDTGAGS
jgi:Zn-dependent protease